jgi:prepilin-type N-terminal cleavage/methylation domain-containing protein
MQRNRKEGGFTLIEILIVMVLIGLSISVVIPNIGNTLDKIRFKGETKKAFELIEKAKFNAFFYQKNIKISEQGNKLVITGMDFSEEEMPDLFYSIRNEISFSPNGVTPGGQILIYFKGKPRTRIHIERFTGKLTLESVEEQ